MFRLLIESLMKLIRKGEAKNNASNWHFATTPNLRKIFVNIWILLKFQEFSVGRKLVESPLMYCWTVTEINKLQVDLDNNNLQLYSACFIDHLQLDDNNKNSFIFRTPYQVFEMSHSNSQNVRWSELIVYFGGTNAGERELKVVDAVCVQTPGSIHREIQRALQIQPEY